MKLPRTWPYLLLSALLVMCLAHGLWVVHGLGPYTAILDTYRDAGFVQGFVDGNLRGDPSIDGAWRYYPPLMHAAGAAVVSVTHMEPLHLLIHGSPWLNLLIPLTFFLALRRLTDAPTAAIATALFVCINGLLLPPWMAATYSPWSSVPAFTQALFFCGVWLIGARTQYLKFADALAIGCMIGLVFLAHTVPALILAAILVAATLATRGIGMRQFAWLALAGLVTTLWAVPFMLPLLSDYHLKIVNASGSFTDPLFDPTRLPKRVIEACAPGLAALLALPFVGRRNRAFIPQSTLAILIVWIGLPCLFMARHYGCGASQSHACTAFVVPVHHWMIYLQSGLACVFGLTCVQALGLHDETSNSARANGLLAGGLLLMALALLIWHPMDREIRERAVDMRQRVDIDLYEWLLRATPPTALFATDIATNAVHDSAAMAVLAAGRRSVALPFTFSSPYIEWQPRKDREAGYLQIATHPQVAPGGLCPLVAEAGTANPAYIVLSNGSATRRDGLQLVLQTAMNTVYSVAPPHCP